ncbi:hypothetical protein BN946_scf184980.g8 [Trametes cinnabarina]|uniref:Metallo-beta-lactamase domain-containing protein n=1 Tax=Pycnoporus cinnabarinus TaxID=5643 RepID=A0A060SD76_PYCCI|nr:hypothetical protein BN946_scf184980.g8 [Trametes cinnabarina]
MCLHHGDTPIPTLTRTHELRADSSSHSPQSPPAFTARRLTGTTFHVTEVDDVYDEHPFIYAKLVPAAGTLLLLDTGCGGASRNPEAAFNRLRDYLERCPVTDNDGLPLNEGGKMEYVVVLSHCHYDHILGVEQFAEDSLILASGHDPAFLAPETLPQHSLCADLGIHAPSYRPVLLSHQAQITSRDRKTLGMTLLHTPGHTPDEVALWDEEEGMLYVGDTLYERAPIIFPSEGSIVKWLGTIDSLTALVTGCGPKGEYQV